MDLPINTAATRLIPLKLDMSEPAEVMAEVSGGAPICRWRKAHYEVMRPEGPERIACEWWKDKELRKRDYFRIETVDGYRLWLFRHGLYARETHRPKWYVGMECQRTIKIISLIMELAKLSNFSLPSGASWREELVCCASLD